MCILLKLHHATFNVSRLFCSKVIKEKPSGGRLDPLVNEGLKKVVLYALKLLLLRNLRNTGFPKTVPNVSLCKPYFLILEVMGVQGSYSRRSSQNMIFKKNFRVFVS